MHDELKWWFGVFAGLIANSVLLTWWINTALHRLDSKIQSERQARTDYFDRRAEALQREIIEAHKKNHELKQFVQQFELRIEQRLSGYPTKNDIKEMLGPLVDKIDNIYTQITNYALSGGQDG